MTLPVVTFSPDQADAYDRISAALRGVGVDLDEATLTPAVEGASRVLAVIGKAGSGKTLLLAELTRALEAAGVDLVSGDYEGKRRKDRRTLAILAPTNKAASVLRNRGVPATTIHRIIYTPVYDPEYERVAEWLAGTGERPEIEGLTDLALERALASLPDPQVDPRRDGGCGAARVGFHHRLEAAGRTAGYRLCR
jgi:exodeoxyribonuclease V